MEQEKKVELINTINSLNLNDLRELSDYVWARIKRLRTIASERQRYLLNYNDKVAWKGKYGPSSGVIVEIRRVNAVVKNNMDGKRWIVPMSMLVKQD